MTWVEDPSLPGGMPCESCEDGDTSCCLVWVDDALRDRGRPVTTTRCVTAAGP